MKRTLLTLFSILCICNLSAQTVSVARIMSDHDMTDYVWAIGYGETIEEADKDAINTLVSYTAQIVKMDKSRVNESEEEFKQELAIMSDVYLENVRREVLPDEGKNKRVLRYLSPLI